MSKTKLNYRDRSNRVRSMTKTTQHNDVIDSVGAVYAKIGTKLS